MTDDYTASARDHFTFGPVDVMWGSREGVEADAAKDVRTALVTELLLGAR